MASEVSVVVDGVTKTSSSTGGSGNVTIKVTLSPNEPYTVEIRQGQTVVATITGQSANAGGKGETVYPPPGGTPLPAGNYQAIVTLPDKDNTKLTQDFTVS